MLADKIKELRKKMGFTQEQLAHNVEVSKNTVLNWETNKRNPREQDLKKLALALETSVAYLMGETNDSTRHNPSLLAAAGRDPASFTGNPPSIADIAPNARRVDVAWIPITSPDIKACCGAGNLYAEDVEWNIIGHYPVPRHMLLGYSWQVGEFFTIHVEGDSMEPRLHDGDLVLFAKLDLSDGDMVVARYRGRLIVRIIRIQGTKVTFLHALNEEMYEDIPIDISDLSVEFCVLGKVLLRLPKAEKMTGLW